MVMGDQMYFQLASSTKLMFATYRVILEFLNPSKEIIDWGIDESKVVRVIKMKARTQHKRDPLPRPNLRLVAKK